MVGAVAEGNALLVVALLELIADGAKRELLAAQAHKLLASVRLQDAVGKTRKRIALEPVVDLKKTYQRKKAANKGLGHGGFQFFRCVTDLIG